jgi:hypothetical protein
MVVVVRWLSVDVRGAAVWLTEGWRVVVLKNCLGFGG